VAMQSIAGEGERILRSEKATGALSVEASLIDLEGDGTYEILIDESVKYSDCDMKGGGSSSRLYLIDGSGAVRWEDEKRHEYLGGGDASAHVRAMDLWGDGAL